jgi:hypothetical protein
MQAVAAASAPSRPPDLVRGAIEQASRATGAPFDYLLRTAQRESSLDPQARAPSSTASGLFQFIEQTWLGVLRETGAQHGFAREAAQIERRPDGRYQVSDAAERERILQLRFDAQANAVMAGVFTQRNTAELSAALGRAPSQGELYAAHFLGAQGAARLLGEAQRTPDAPAAAQFPDAARANRSLFYARDGRAVSLAELRDRLAARHQGGADATAALAAAEQASGTPPPAVPEGPVFHSLFQVGARGAVAPVVQSLWGGRGQSLVASRGPEPFYPSSSGNMAAPAASPGPPPAVTAAIAPAAAGPPAQPASPAVARPGLRTVPPRVPAGPLDLLALTRGAPRPEARR